MHPIRKMFEDYTALKNINVSRQEFPTEEDFISHIYGIEQEIEAIGEQLKSNGYKPVFVRVDSDGVYHYVLEEI